MDFILLSVFFFFFFLVLEIKEKCAHWQRFAFKRKKKIEKLYNNELNLEFCRCNCLKQKRVIFVEFTVFPNIILAKS